MNKNFKDILMILVISGLIYLAGAMSSVLIIYKHRDDEINRLKIDLIDKEEQIYQLDVEKNRLESIINNYTIEERKEEV